MLVVVALPRKAKNMEERVAEMKDLSYSAGLSVLDVVLQRPKELHPRFLVGQGQDRGDRHGMQPGSGPRCSSSTRS